MPALGVAAAVAIRYIIMAAVQLGIWWALEKYGIPLLNKAVEEIMQAFGLSEEEAKAVMANKVILAFEEVGIFAVTLRTKMPIKVAEYLGFTSKGFALRKLAPATELKLAKVTTAEISAIKTEVKTAEKIAEVVAKTRGVALPSAKALLATIATVVGIPTGFFFALAQYIDFANWQGPYQKFFQRLLSHIGINPDTPMPKANVVSPDIWKRIYSTIEELNPIGISFPFETSDRIYNRQNLSDLVDSVAAQMAKAGGSTSYKNVLGAILPLIHLTTENRTDATIDAIFNKYQPLSGGSSGGGTTTPTVKVFTGIVSQGVVGAGLVFTPRPDDMIESVSELREAASNNLAPFLNTLLGKIVYEVKVVPSVITKEGFKQTGTTQKIQTGTFANGTPKYKTVTNKFATLVVYALTDKGSRAKLTTIVLGPTDSAKLTVGQNDLRTLETQLPALVTTTDINAITGIADAKGDVTPTKQDAPKAEATNEKTFIIDADIYKFAEKFKTEGMTVNSGDYGVLVWRNEILYRGSDGARAIVETPKPATVTTPKQNAPAPVTAPVVSTSSVAGAKPGAKATTLFEWYQAQGRSLPSVSARSVVYASLGLGVQGYYTGTAEQNTKLLAALKNS